MDAGDEGESEHYMMISMGKDEHGPMTEWKET